MEACSVERIMETRGVNSELLISGESVIGTERPFIVISEEMAPKSKGEWSIGIRIGVFIGILLFGLIGYLECERRFGGVFTDRYAVFCGVLTGICTVLWSSGIIPMEITSIMVIFVVIISGVLSVGGWMGSISSVIGISFSKVSMLIIGSCFLSTYFQENGGGSLLAPWLLGGSGKPEYILRSMLCSLGLSSIMSNITAPIIIISVIRSTVEESYEEALGPIIMGVALGSNLGGMLLPISSPQSMLGSMYMGAGWGEWMFFSVPTTFACGILVYLMIYLFFPEKEIRYNTYQIRNISKKRKWKLIIAIGVSVGCWSVPDAYSLYSVVYMVPVVFFLFTKGISKSFNRKTAEILSIYIAGKALGLAIERTGVLREMANILISDNKGHTLLFAIILLSFIMLISSCLVCHTVSAAILLPMFQVIGGTLKKEKLIIGVCALACSCGMALPSSGFPNILSSGYTNKNNQLVLNKSQFILLGTISTIGTWLVIVSVSVTAMLIMGY
ncbi:phosphate transporter [Nematocida sp. LUAm3]|nr:phosphate transporter [Nematocida sp. LUAm3]KAI5173551.1 phosphate transporter [Nematocida sp. LUAm2]KAI5176772.1 phosphate transporter [Nematocida sp. LUAm1]